MSIYVGNLSYETNEKDIETAFTAYGQVGEVRLITDRDTGRSKGFAFVEMPNQREAVAAIQNLHGKPLQNRTINVNEAKPRDNSGQRGGGGGSRSW